MKRNPALWIATAVLSSGLCIAQKASVDVDGAGAYRTGHYRNLMPERGHSPAEIDARLQQAFEQFFHGDPATQTVYYPAGSNSNGPLAYITDVGNNDARSEGMSYGMMAAVQMNHKAEFDALWNWANTYMLITDPANPSFGYYAWSMNTDGTARSDSPAPDGEEYFAMSLLFAANRWGNGTGLYDYQAQADRILRLMRHHPVTTATGPFRVHPKDAPWIRRGSSPTVETIGPMVNEENAMILFVPGNSRGVYTDASYHLPAFYELWARWGPVEDRDFWARAAAASRSYFTRATNPKTGFSSDYGNFDGSPHKALFNENSANFSNDSWRTASNWAVDQAWWGKNPQARVLSDRIQGFLFAQGIHTFADRFTTAGVPVSAQHSTGLVATTAATGLAASDGPIQAAFLDELWATPMPSGHWRYYDGFLYLFSMLHATGNFRIWMPPQSTTPHRRH